MAHLESVNSVGFNRWHWVAKGPVGTRRNGTLKSTTKSQMISFAWRSLDGNITNAGSVHFDRPRAQAPGSSDHELQRPWRKVSALLAKVFGHEPGQMIEGDLKRLKELFERGKSPALKAGLPQPSRIESSTDNSLSSDQASASMTPANELAENHSGVNFAID